MKVIAAWAEPASGPGWANRPVWYIKDNGRSLEVECIQPSDWAGHDEVSVLYGVDAAVSGAFRRAVERLLAGEGFTKAGAGVDPLAHREREALERLIAVVEDAAAEMAEDFQRPHDLACELRSAVRRAREAVGE